MRRAWWRIYARWWRSLPAAIRECLLAFAVGGLVAAVLLRLLGVG